MSDPNDWLEYGNIACLIAIGIIFIQYVIRTKWNDSQTGRAIALLTTLTLINFCINYIGNITDEVIWSWVRVFLKFGIAAGLLNLIWVMEKARNEKVITNSESADDDSDGVKERQ